MNTSINMINKRYPGLVEKIREKIENAEKEFDGDGGESYLWEHTLMVSSVAGIISKKEQIDPVPVILSAFFHDSGKFVKGNYHSNDIPEEEDSIKVAKEIMEKFDIDKTLIEKVVNSLKSLYFEGSVRNLIADIIHDADFLSKSGPVGIPVYFSKGVLRRKSLINWLIDTASKEITYNFHLEPNMRTSKGKEIASSNSKFTLNFFNTLFSDLKTKEIAHFKILTEDVRTEKYPNGIEIKLAIPETCPECSSSLELKKKQEKGIKCEKMLAAINCKSCSYSKEIFFCIPEITRN